MKHVSRTEAAAEMAVLPRMIQVVPGIARAAVMSHPFAVGVDMRGVGMPLVIAEVLLRWRGRMRRGCMRSRRRFVLHMRRGGTVRRYVSVPDLPLGRGMLAALSLGARRDRNNQQ